MEALRNSLVRGDVDDALDSCAILSENSRHYLPISAVGFVERQ